MGARTIDLTAVDYAFQTDDRGRTGSVTSWSAYRKDQRPDAGDYLLLRNGARSTRYRVVEVNQCRNVDPPTMFIARVAFDPRS